MFRLASKQLISRGKGYALAPRLSIFSPLSTKSTLQSHSPRFTFIALPLSRANGAGIASSFNFSRPARSFSTHISQTVEEIEVSEFHQEKRKVLHSKYKVFIAKVHPDRFRSVSEEYRKLNEESMQQLTALFDAIWTFIARKDPATLHALPSPMHLKFVFKGRDYRLLKTSFYLPVSILLKEKHEEAVPLLWNFYEQCIDQLEKDLKKIAH